MNFNRTWALIERDLRKFFRSPALMMTSMVFPLMQLIVLGYAFGGKVVGVQVAFVDKDHSVESLKVREMFNGIAANAKTFHVIDYDSEPKATEDLRNGYVRGVVYVPKDFSERYYHHDRPRIAFMEDNTDQFISSAILERVQQMVEELNAPDVTPRLAGQVQLNTVEIYPYIEYIKYLLAGSIALSIFVVAMIGGGITFIDDKARGLHEGYLRHSHQENGTGHRVDRRGNGKGLNGWNGVDHHRRNDCGNSANLGSFAIALSGHRCDCGCYRHDEFHVSADGARGRSARTTRDVWRSEHVAVLPFRCRVSYSGFPSLASLDCDHRPVHLYRARAS